MKIKGLSEDEMSEITIEIKELKYKGEEKIKDLIKFLEGRLGVGAEASDDKLILTFEEEEVIPKKSYLRVILKKFLHKTTLKEDYKVLSGGEKSFIIKERKRS